MSRIEDQANYYKNIPLRDRAIKAVVHLEDKEDESFWKFQLQNSAPGQYHFIHYSKNDNQNDTTGCEQCLNYRPYVNNRFFICIDSDLRLLRNEDGLTADNFIAQTHTYSWENHYCEANYLQQRFSEKVKDSDFDFRIFLHNLSRIVYLPLLFLVEYKTPALNTVWNITKFNKCIPLQPARKELSDNGALYLQKIKRNFDNALSSFHLPGDFEIAGLSPDNAYLHIQGHQLYKLIMHIGSLLCRGQQIAFRSEILDNSLHTSGYDEIDCVQSDLRTILQ